MDTLIKFGNNLSRMKARLRAAAFGRLSTHTAGMPFGFTSPSLRRRRYCGVGFAVAATTASSEPGNFPQKGSHSNRCRCRQPPVLLHGVTHPPICRAACGAYCSCVITAAASPAASARWRSPWIQFTQFKFNEFLWNFTNILYGQETRINWFMSKPKLIKIRNHYIFCRLELFYKRFQHCSA